MNRNFLIVALTSICALMDLSNAVSSKINEVDPSPVMLQCETTLSTMVRPICVSRLSDLKINAPLFVINISPEAEFSKTSIPLGPKVLFNIASKVSHTFSASLTAAIRKVTNNTNSYFTMGNDLLTTYHRT